MLADDAEARGGREEAAARHEDRIEVATTAAAALEGAYGIKCDGSFVLMIDLVWFRGCGS